MGKLGNKSLLEKRINIRASDYRFSDKKLYYRGGVNKRGQTKDGIKIAELLKIHDERLDFVEADIIVRTNAIINSFVKFVEVEGLTM